MATIYLSPIGNPIKRKKPASWIWRKLFAVSCGINIVQLVLFILRHRI